jgi:hypothetical protein
MNCSGKLLKSSGKSKLAWFQIFLGNLSDTKKKNFKAQAFYLSIRNLLLALMSALIPPNPLVRKYPSSLAELGQRLMNSYLDII